MKSPRSHIARHCYRAGLYCLTFCVSLLLSSCATVIGPQEVEVSLTKMQEKIDQRFPIQKRVLSVVDVRLTHPRLAILPQTEKVALAVDAALSSPLLPNVLVGKLAFSGRLKLDEQQQTLVLNEVKIDQLDINTNDEDKRQQLATIANLLATQLVKEVPVYRFDPDDLRRLGVQFKPAKIATKSQSLVIIFEPQR